MEKLLAIIIIISGIWLFIRHRRKKSATVTPHKEECPPRRLSADATDPLAGYDAEGDALKEYIFECVKKRSNTNFVFDLYPTSYMRGLSLQEKKRARAITNVIEDSFNIIRNSKKSETIISRYDVVIQRFELLLSEFYIPDLKEKLLLAKDYKPAITTAAYYNDIQILLEKLNTAKTNKSKQNCIDKISSLLDKILFVGYAPREEILALRRFIQL